MRRPPDGGFSLIEVIVAVAILAMALAALFDGLAAGWRGVRAAQLELAALEVARSQLAREGVEHPLQEGRREGRSASGFTWVSTIVREAAAHTNGTFATPAAYWVNVAVSWPSGPRGRMRSVELTTLKLGRAQ